MRQLEPPRWGAFRIRTETTSARRYSKQGHANLRPLQIQQTMSSQGLSTQSTFSGEGAPKATSNNERSADHFVADQAYEC